jgi:hypothetical protein
MVGEEELRLATALVHGIPGVTLALHCVDGGEVVVAAQRLDAQLDPCGLRAGVVAARRCGARELTGTLAAVEVRLGLRDLGGGLYGRGASGGERWFATLLDGATVGDLLGGCPVDAPAEALVATVKPDDELGATVVRLAAHHPAAARHLDATASWAVAVCMVEELVRAARRAVDR